MSAKSFAGGVVVGVLVFGSVAALANINVVGGLVGVKSGYGMTTAVCVDQRGEINAGSQIQTVRYPVNDGNGKSAVGVTFICP